MPNTITLNGLIIGSKAPFSSEEFVIRGVVSRKNKDQAPIVYKKICEILVDLEVKVDIKVCLSVGDKFEPI